MINGIPIVVKMAELAVKLRRLTGLGVSRVSDYIQPPAEVIEEFMADTKGLRAVPSAYAAWPVSLTEQDIGSCQNSPLKARKGLASALPLRDHFHGMSSDGARTLTQYGTPQCTACLAQTPYSARLFLSNKRGAPDGALYWRSAEFR